MHPPPRWQPGPAVRLCAITGTQNPRLAITVVPCLTAAAHAKPRRRAPYIYLARDSRARWAVRMCADVAGFRFTWPGKECFCRAGRLQDWEAVSHAVRETTNTSTAAAKGFALDRQTACDYPNAEPKVGHDRRDVLVGGGARKAKARRRALYIHLARVSRARVGLCGCVRTWPVFGSLGPARNSSAGPDDFEDGKQCLMQSMTQPTPCPLPTKAAGLTVGLRAITEMRARRLATGAATRPESPRTLSKAKQGAGPHIYTSGAFRARARCRVRIVRILHRLCAVAARAVYENRGGSAALRGRGGLPGSG